MRTVISMILCPRCHNELITGYKGYLCQICGSNYETDDGIHKLVSEDNSEECFFPDDAFDLLYRSEERNFWFRVRNTIIGFFITRYLPSPARILEVGCGTGYVSRYLKKNGYHNDCADLFVDALHYCKKRDAGERYYQFNLMDGIIIGEYDGICAFDVLEHIDDDKAVLHNLRSALKPDGHLFITVPADMRLWSDIDIFAEHKRRYSQNELQKKLEECGFKVERISYYMTLLYPVLRLTRHLSTGHKGNDGPDHAEQVKKDAMKELQPSTFLNSLLFLIFSMECLIIRYLNLPFGSSLICVAVRES